MSGTRESQYGLRAGRRAHDALLQAQRYVQDGYRVVVDVDLEKFFDRVNHDILMERLSRKIDDKAVLRLIRHYLMVGIMDARKAKENFKQRIREMTRRSSGRGLPEIVERLRAYIPGWKAYFHLAQTPKVFRELDEWIRHRLRAMQLKHWCRGTTMYRELLALGASKTDAHRVAANSRRWWRNSCMLLNRALPVAYFDRLGVPRLS
jgi:hypothetical protein